MSRCAIAIGLLLLASTAACYRTHVYSGAPVGPASVIAEDVSHHAIVLGVAELSPPGDLDGACPGVGWSKVTESVSPLQVVLQLATFGVYTPRTYTIACAGQPGAGPAAPLAPGAAPPPGYVPASY